MLRRFSQQWPILTFCLFAYLISWIIWLPLILERHGLVANLPKFWHYIGSIGPILSVLLVHQFLGDKGNIKQFVRDLLIVPAQFRWILIGAGLPFLFLFCGVVINALVNGGSVSFSGALNIPEFSGWNPFVVVLFQMLTFGVGEEVGWRGFLLPQLQQKRPAWLATLWVTLIWAFWHFPAFFYRSGYLEMGVAAIMGWLFSLLAGSYILTWIFNKSRGSILAVILFHTSVEFAFLSEISLGKVSMYTGAIFMIFSLMVLFVFGLTPPKRGDQPSSNG